MKRDYWQPIGSLICTVWIWCAERYGESIDRKVCGFPRDTSEEES